MIVFVKPQTPNIDMDPPYKEVGSTPLGRAYERNIVYVHVARLPFPFVRTYALFDKPSTTVLHTGYVITLYSPFAFCCNDTCVESAILCYLYGEALSFEQPVKCCCHSNCGTNSFAFGSNNVKWGVFKIRKEKNGS